MTKRWDGLFEKITSIENINLAFEKACFGKKSYRAIKKAIPNKENLCKQLQQDLISHRYTTSEYNHKKIYEPKERDIFVLPFYPDRIVHHAIMNIMEPLWDNQLIDDSFACRKNKGQTVASDRCMKYTTQFKYCLKCDISKFYPSINHDILKKILRKKIKDDQLLWLIDDIIDSVECETNVPIGNYLSQWFGNLYMNYIDRIVKNQLKCKGYVRYCDDFLLFSNDKDQLTYWLKIIEFHLHNDLKLKLSKKMLLSTKQGVEFIGYRHFNSQYKLVKKKTLRKFVSKVKYIKNHYQSASYNQLRKFQNQLASLTGWMKHSNHKGFDSKYQISQLVQDINNLISQKENV